MRIALATPYYVSGFGIENRVTELIKHLPPDIDKKILCLQYSRPAPRGTTITQLPKPLHLLTSHRSVRFSVTSRLIRNAYFRPILRNCDIIDAQYFPMTALPRAQKNIITWHSVTFPEYANNAKEAKIWNKEYQTILDNMRKADLVIPVSKWAEGEVKQFDNSIPTAIVPNGVDLNKFIFKPLERREKTIISVGRFTPHKGHLEIISILKQVIDELKDSKIRLILIGTKSNKEYFAGLEKYAESIGINRVSMVEAVQRAYSCDRTSALDLIKESKNLNIPPPKSPISYLTDVPDIAMPSIYQMGDIFVSCSHWEGFGMPMIEAQACGLPALGYRMCSHPEVVANQDFLSEENDTWSIAENIKRLLTDDDYYNKSALQARAFAEQFGWDIVAKQYLSTIKRVVDS